MNDSLLYDEKYYKVKYSALRVIVIDGKTKILVSYRLFYTSEEDITSEVDKYISKIYFGNIVLLVHTILEKFYFIQNFNSIEILSLCLKNSNNLNFYLIFEKGFRVCKFGEISESLNKKTVYHSFGVVKKRDFNCLLKFGEMKEALDRVKFCESYFAFPEFCDCVKPHPIRATGKRLSNEIEKELSKIPVLIIASDRANYLVECIKSILSARGVQPQKIIIDIDQEVPEIIALIQLFNLNIANNLATCVGECRISEHYRTSLGNIFNINSPPEFIFIFEDDLIVSDDIFYYFQSFLKIYKSDESILCISAWNDHGFKHSVGDLTMSYRINYMPGLGVVFSKEMILKFLKSWPPRVRMNWDFWVRDLFMHDKKCIIPDVSRTFHVGKLGIHSSAKFQKEFFDVRYFQKHINVNISTDNLTKIEYDKFMRNLVNSVKEEKNYLNVCKRASKKNQNKLLNSALSFQDLALITKKVYIKNENEDYENYYRSLFRCLNTWSVDKRGLNDNYFRVWIQNIHYIFITCPKSSLCDVEDAQILN